MNTKPDIKRLCRHLAQTHWQVRRAFPPASLCAIERAIASSEAAHQGELRFVVEGALSGSPLFHAQSAHERAIDVFSQLRMWDTDHRNGVLIYLLLADRSVEIIADRGMHAKAGSAAWDAICRKMEAAFRAGQFEAGATDGILAVTQLLTQHFPAGGVKRNELPDKVLLM